MKNTRFQDIPQFKEDIWPEIKRIFNLPNDFFNDPIWHDKNEPRGRGRRVSFYVPPEYSDLLEEAKKLSKNPKYKTLSNFILESLKLGVFEASGRKKIDAEITRLMGEIYFNYRNMKMMKIKKEIDDTKEHIKGLISDFKQAKEKFSKIGK